MAAMLAKLEEAYPHDRPSDNLLAVVDLWREMSRADRARWRPLPSADAEAPPEDAARPETEPMAASAEAAPPEMEAADPKAEAAERAFYASVISVVAVLGFRRADGHAGLREGGEEGEEGQASGGQGGQV